MMVSNVKLVPCKEEDFDDYFRVKCGESEIFWMGYAGKPKRELMRNCFMSRLGDHNLLDPGDKRIYMIKVDDKNVGMIQFTLSDEGLEFGISIDKEEQGKGYGSAGMKLAVIEAGKYSEHCFAHIRDDNYASQKALMRAGLKRTDKFKMVDFPQTGEVAYRLYEM